MAPPTIIPRTLRIGVLLHDVPIVRHARGRVSLTRSSARPPRLCHRGSCAGIPVPTAVLNQPASTATSCGPHGAPSVMPRDPSTRRDLLALLPRALGRVPGPGALPTVGAPTPTGAIQQRR